MNGVGREILEGSFEETKDEFVELEACFGEEVFQNTIGKLVDIKRRKGTGYRRSLSSRNHLLPVK